MNASPSQRLRALRSAASIIALAAAAFSPLAHAQTQAEKLISFDSSFDPSSLETRDAKATKTDDGRLRLDFGHSQEWPGATFKPKSGDVWDLSKCRSISATALNAGKSKATLKMRVDNPGGDGLVKSSTSGFDIEPGQTKTITIAMNPSGYKVEGLKLVGMNGSPIASETLDCSKISQIIIFAPRPSESSSFIVSPIEIEPLTSVKTMSKEEFLPFIDEFGQFIHADWPGKIHSQAELAKALADEEKDLAGHPAPKSFDRFGGWADGPALEASGFFRAEKWNGKWWLVDPEGKLFWSHGVDGVRSGSASTPVTGRREYFKELPASGPLAAFYEKTYWAPQGFYKDMPKPFDSYNFSAANLYRKYGEDWAAKFRRKAQERLKSWAMNTIGNWSDDALCKMDLAPYVRFVSSDAPSIEGSSGWWGKFPDPFNPAFRSEIAKHCAKEAAPYANDPFCIGYFIGNELAWDHAGGLGLSVLKSPSSQAAKKALLKRLEAKYGSIEKLNAAWGAKYASFEALGEDTKPDEALKKSRDLIEFSGEIASEYFKICKEELSKAAPKQLYLGCRFAGEVDALVAKAAAESCDVVSYNIYRHDVESLRIPGGIDRPIIIGEFHFGALDRGMFHAGLVPTRNQEERAAAYKAYVEGALRNPQIVGTHWFLFGSQAATGRPDGENYQVGLASIADTPYSETISAIRETGAKMYQLRSKGE